MNRFSRRFTTSLCLCALLLAGLQLGAPSRADDIAERARKLHFSSIVLDTHDDTTQRFFYKNFDLGKRNPDGHVDIPRMREGGMNAIFFSIWIDGRIMGPPAVQKALDQIDAVHENVARYSKDLAFCRTAEEVLRAHAQGKIAALIGVEGGHMIGNDIRILRMFGDLGVRHAVALPSCTSAIHLALAALGVGPGDEVIVPELTWIASSAPIKYVGAEPVFADVDPVSWCLSAEAFQRCISPRTKAVISVDLYGNLPDAEAIREMAKRHGIAVLTFPDARSFLNRSFASFFR